MIRRVLGQVVHDVAEPGVRAGIAELRHQHGVPRIELPSDGRDVLPDHGLLLAQSGRRVAPEPESVERAELRSQARRPRGARGGARRVDGARQGEERHVGRERTRKGQPRQRGARGPRVLHAPRPLDQLDQRPANQQIARRQEGQEIPGLTKVHQRVDGESGQHPEREEDRAVVPPDEASRGAAQAPYQDRQEEPETDEEGLGQADHVPEAATPEHGRRPHRRLVELEARGDVAFHAGEPQHRAEPRDRRQQYEPETGQDRPRPPEPAPGHAEPERTHDQQHRLPHAAGQSQEHRRADERSATSSPHRPRGDRDARGQSGLGGVGETDHAVGPEQRAHREPESGQQGGPAAVQMPAEMVDEEHRDRARQRREPVERGRRVAGYHLGQAPERHVEDVPRRMRLMPHDVVPLEGERELDRVPGWQDTGAVRPARRQGQGRDGESEGPVRSR